VSDIKNVFVEMKEEKKAFDFDSTQVDLYMKARDIEKRAEEFYLQKADEVDDPEQKAIFKQIAAEEKKHYALFDNIVDFVSAPETWLENAEWHHLDQY
jgi:rubrerythrin